MVTLRYAETSIEMTTPLPTGFRDRPFSPYTYKTINRSGYDGNEWIKRAALILTVSCLFAFVVGLMTALVDFPSLHGHSHAPTIPAGLKMIDTHAAPDMEVLGGLKFSDAVAEKTGAEQSPFWIAFAAHESVSHQMFAHASALGIMQSNAADLVHTRIPHPLTGRELRLCYHVALNMGHQFRLGDIFVGPFTARCPPGIAELLCGKGCDLEDGFGVYAPINLEDSVTAVSPEHPGLFVGKRLQSYKYFEHVAPVVKQLYSLHPAEIDRAADHLEDLILPLWLASINRDIAFDGLDMSDVNVIGVHFRRDHHAKKGGTRYRFPPDPYFQSAISLLESRHEKRRYMYILVIASDVDVEYIMKNVPSIAERRDVVYSRLGMASPSLDFAMLRQCQHVITTLGSFGWWAGYLSSGEVVYYKDQFNMSHPLNEGKIDPADYWLPSWVGISDLDLDSYARMSLILKTSLEVSDGGVR